VHIRVLLSKYRSLPNAGLPRARLKPDALLWRLAARRCARFNIHSWSAAGHALPRFIARLQLPAPLDAAADLVRAIATRCDFSKVGLATSPSMPVTHAFGR